jgi:hypothetical protein
VQDTCVSDEIVGINQTFTEREFSSKRTFLNVKKKKLFPGPGHLKQCGRDEVPLLSHKLASGLSVN